jgi:hypothetical protein
MKRKGYSEQQIAFTLRQYETGTTSGKAVIRRAACAD